MKFKLSKEEKNWILYDIGNSAFILLVSTILPTYFNYLANNAGINSVDYLAYWGYAASISTLIVFLLGPIMGSLADNKGYKKKIFIATILIGIICCALMGFMKSYIIFLGIFIIAKVGFSSSLIFYDAMLSDVTTEERMDRVSSQGYAWGYLGSCIPFIISLLFILGHEKICISLEMAMCIVLIINALWWLVMSIPLVKSYKQRYYVEKENHVIKGSFKRLCESIRNMMKNKKIFLFLLAFFFYIDGVYTIIDMATAYGTALGFDTTGLLLTLLVTQFVAFPFTIIFGRLSDKYDTGNLIKLCIVAYLAIIVFAVFMVSQWQFWVLAIFVGMFQGGIQALSRSYYAKIIPPEKSGEYFGLLDICGKGASFIGTFIVGTISQLTGDISKGISMISVLFIVGIILFMRVDKKEVVKEINKDTLIYSSEGID